MKHFIAIALLSLMPVIAQAEMPLTLAGSSVGYGIQDPDAGELFTAFWGGVRLKTVSEHTAIYTCYQHIGMNGGKTGDGTKMLIVSGSEKAPWLYLFTEVGWATSIASETEGGDTAGMTAGGGAALQFTEHVAPFVYFSAYDSGPRFAWSMHTGLVVSNLQQIAGIVF